MGSGGLAVDAMAVGCLGAERRVERFFALHFIFALLEPLKLPGKIKYVGSQKYLFSLDLGQKYNYFVWTNRLSAEFRETSKY